MIYKIQGTIEIMEGRFQTAYSFPTFFLMAEIQGITSNEHAKEIAKDVVDPGKIAKNVNIHVELINRQYNQEGI